MVCRLSRVKVLITALMGIAMATQTFAGKNYVLSALRTTDKKIKVKLRMRFSGEATPESIQIFDYESDKPVKIESVKARGSTLIVKTAEPMLPYRNYRVRLADQRGKGVVAQFDDRYLNSFYSDKPLGVNIEGKYTVFRLFAPRAKSVKLVLYKSIRDKKGKEYDMVRDKDGVWELKLRGRYFGKLYGYRVDGPKGKGEMFDPKIVVADPYSFALATFQKYRQHHRSIIVNMKKYNWRGDKPIGLDQRDAIIYECHIRDMTAHPSSGVPRKIRGTYKGFIKKIPYIKELGVNAVEFLPINEFDEIEAPYMDRKADVLNTWNPYERNHWGYMTTCYFAPEGYYSWGRLDKGKWIAYKGKQVNEYRDLIRALHKNGIAVIMDVVYNHVSQYDINPLKYIDSKYYFWRDEKGGWRGSSGCGNDFKTDRPMARRLIVDAIKFWMTQYHVDGFRFDLATMIDWGTIEEIVKEAKKINPKVILIAEPWGGGKYDLGGFSKRGMGAWNDRIRNTIRGGANATYKASSGFAFGRASESDLKNSVKGWPGIFKNPAHSVNYIESHDNNTFGDFIRLGNADIIAFISVDDYFDKIDKAIEKIKKAGIDNADEVISYLNEAKKKLKDISQKIKTGKLTSKQVKKLLKDYNKTLRPAKKAIGSVIKSEKDKKKRRKLISLMKAVRKATISSSRIPELLKVTPDMVNKFVKLTEKQLKQHKVSALLLLTCQGAVMLHEGQEYARSKIVFPPKPMPKKWPRDKAKPWTIDHDSYEKDNETNWLNYEQVKINKSLFEYYKGLIALRKKYRAFRWTPSNAIKFLKAKKRVQASIGWLLPKSASKDKYDIVVVVNGNHKKSATFKLPDGNWYPVVTPEKAGTKPIGKAISGEVSLEPITGMVLIKK